MTGGKWEHMHFHVWDPGYAAPRTLGNRTKLLESRFQRLLSGDHETGL